MSRFPQTASDRAHIIATSLAVFGCTREALAQQYLRNAEQSDRSARLAAQRGGTYRNYPADFYVAHAKYARLMAFECCATVPAAR